MKIYLAGFDVFRPDAEAVFYGLRAEAARLGMVALVPFDNEVDKFGVLEPHARAKLICKANMEMIGQADGVVANLAPFRGMEPDSGTVFEVGVAVAMGLPVMAYGAFGTYAERATKAIACERSADGALRETVSGMLVEDFGLPANLMLACSVEFYASSTQALAKMARRLTGGP